MAAVCRTRIARAGQRLSGCKDVALNAGDLHHPVDRVARQPEVVFQTHFGRVFHLARRSPQKLCSRPCRHGTCHADLPLTANLGARNRRIMLHQIANEPGSGKRAQDRRVTALSVFLHMAQYGWDDPARTAGGRRHDNTAGSVFFCHSKGVCRQ